MKITGEISEATAGTCEADQLAYAACKHPAKWHAVQGRQSCFDHLHLFRLCGRHARHVRRLPSWRVTKLGGAA